MEITKREIIASVSIIAIMLLIGVLLFGSVTEAKMDANERYNKAVKIENTELFQYGMDTNIGYAFIYGNLTALDPVSYPDVEGEYLSIQKVKERYTRHTRTVTTTVNGETTTRTEEYWTWDVVGRESKTAERVEFCGVEFNSSQFKLPHRPHIETIKESSKIRYKYYGSEISHKGTIFTDLRDGNIEEKGVSFYKNKDIDEAFKSLTSSLPLFIFWIVWIILIGVLVYGFYYLDNKWLH